MIDKNSEYDKLMEKILGYFSGGVLADELVMAKKEFFGGTGLLDEHTEQFDSRMAQFYDWYFYTRELKGYGQTPLESCHLVRELRFSNEEQRLLDNMKKHRHSIFEFIKMKGDEVYLRDLLSDKKITVLHGHRVFGFDQKEYFEVRIIPDGDNWIFTRGFCFHPENAKKFILEEVKKHRKDSDLDPDVFLLRLIKMRYKYEQYKHVKPEMIYSNEGKLGL